MDSDEVITTIKMENISTLLKYKPLKELLDSVLTRGTVMKPLFKLADVAKHVGDTNYRHNTEDFGENFKVTMKYHDGIRGQPEAHFLTEKGLYRYILRIKDSKGEDDQSDKKQKAKNFRKMVIEILEETRLQMIGFLTSKLSRVVTELENFPYPNDIDKQVNWHIAKWCSFNTANMTTIYLPFENVEEDTRRYIKDAIRIGKKGDIWGLINEDYNEIYEHLHGKYKHGELPVVAKPLHEKYAERERLDLN